MATGKPLLWWRAPHSACGQLRVIAELITAQPSLERIRQPVPIGTETSLERRIARGGMLIPVAMGPVNRLKVPDTADANTGRQRNLAR